MAAKMSMEHKKRGKSLGRNMVAEIFNGGGFPGFWSHADNF